MSAFNPRRANKSSRPSSRPANPTVADSLRLLMGMEQPGGCDYCDAYQTTEEVQPRVFGVLIHHDDDCPYYVAHMARRNA